jgi:hypothetical protein
MIKQLSLFIILSLCSLAALAVPSVTDVESTINSGDYAKAKTQLQEVLKVHPDSIVANRYMLEVIKIEYAGSLQPSVEYKVYENKVNQLEKEKNARIAAKKAEEERLAHEAFMKRFWSFMIWGLCLVLAGGLILGAIVLVHKQIEKKRLAKEEIKWRDQAYSKFVELNAIFDRLLEDEDECRRKYSSGGVFNLKNLREDNKEAMEAVQNGDYQKDMINRHFENAYKYLDVKGMT